MTFQPDATLIPRCKTLSVADALSLADRLETRAASLTPAGEPDLRDDLALAVQAIRGMSRSFQKCDLVRIGA